MATAKRYGVFQRRDPTVEVFGHGCESKAQLDQWVANMPGFFVGMTAIEDEDLLCPINRVIPAPE